MTRPNVRGSWYHQTVIECPRCGRAHSYRTRQLPPRPANPERRRTVIQDSNCPCLFDGPDRS